jgi:hypothetical protein
MPHGPPDVDGAVDVAVPELLLMPLIEVAADVLGIGERTLYRKIKAYHLE